eukprot:Amastigsp_a179480_8.p3 type:complete len:137 gc:universal Amastigsp_a179480_8:581-171(-)
MLQRTVVEDGRSTHSGGFEAGNSASTGMSSTKSTIEFAVTIPWLKTVIAWATAPPAVAGSLKSVMNTARSAKPAIAFTVAVPTLLSSLLSGELVATATPKTTDATVGALIRNPNTTFGAAVSLARVAIEQRSTAPV